MKVGKTYKYPGDEGVYRCDYVGKNMAILSYGERELSSPRHHWHYYKEHVEPKRWSKWQNVYPETSNGGGLIWLTRKDADEAADPFFVRVAVLRRDFEQLPGKPAKCVKVELETV